MTKITDSNSHYDYFLEKFPCDNIRAVGWGTEKKSAAIHDRVMELLVGSLWLSVLDVGCGLGELLSYIDCLQNEGFSYYGIDCHSEMIKRVPDYLTDIGRFEHCSLEDCSRRKDIVISIGAFNLAADDNMGDLRKNLRKMYDLCNESVIVSLLTGCPKVYHTDLWYYDIVDVARLLGEEYPRYNIIRDYAKDDFIIQIMKK